MDEVFLKQAVIETGLILKRAGLVARTWGNISRRVDENHFFISPSGIFYEDIRPEHLSRINKNDLSSTGATKPSSEKRLHAAIYRDHPGVMAIIHTHQPAASSIAAARIGLSRDVPCAPYALPTTSHLARKAAETLAGRQNWIRGSLLLANHGALCTAATLDDAVDEAQSLEIRAACFVKEHRLLLSPSSGKDSLAKAYDRAESLGARPVGEGEKVYRRADRENRPDEVENVFSHNNKADYIIWSKLPYTLAFSELNKTLEPYLDDMAQLIGIKARTCNSKISCRKKSALFISSKGALCLGTSLSEARAIQTVMEKSARCAIEAPLISKAHVISLPGRVLMRVIYKMKCRSISERGY